MLVIRVLIIDVMLMKAYNMHQSPFALLSGSLEGWDWGFEYCTKKSLSQLVFNI